MKLSTKLLVLFFACGFTVIAIAQPATGTDPDWLRLNASMDKMHMAMTAIERSGNDDVDFVRLMIPHHQAAVDMARIQLVYGKDPQMRVLAQKIITDQESEIALMHGWLREQQSAQVEINPTPPVTTARGN
jgi:uncharacterized protein (DUF305 family)